ncbi:DUF1778 domain-containing protein [Umezawaea sp.]|uniref:type II toxin-antitoxin system TacA family antitoxin n=1 Tax=Umezawaea sp. TaxID=1955258 RepID=UPI002ED268F7
MSGGGTSTEEARLDFRLDPEVKARIERAAKLSGESVSTFVVHAATAAADGVLARAEATVMPAEQFDALRTCTARASVETCPATP